MNEYLVDHMVAINAKCNCVSIVFSEQQPFCIVCFVITDINGYTVLCFIHHHAILTF